jgi:hypothetical protein
MNCECGNKLNSYNKDGICNECVTENRWVTVRFVITAAGVIHPCWSLSDYNRCIDFCRKEKDTYEIIELPGRAERIVNIKRNLNESENGGDCDVESLVRDLIDFFIVDVMKKCEDGRDISCSKLIESFDVWKWDSDRYHP